MDFEDIAEYRRAKLQAFLDLKFEGKKAALGRALGYKDGAFVGQMLRGERPISEKTVDQIQALSGGRGWFEQGLVQTLEDWRLKASSKSQEVIDQLTLLAKKNMLRDEDWQLIEQMIQRFVRK